MVGGGWAGGRGALTAEVGSPRTLDCGRLSELSGAPRACNSSALFMIQRRGGVGWGLPEGTPCPPILSPHLSATVPEAARSHALLIFPGWALHSFHGAVVKQGQLAKSPKTKTNCHDDQSELSTGQVVPA